MVESGAKRRRFDNRESRRAYWRDHIENWQRSGQSKHRYCRVQGLNPSSFYRWCDRLNGTVGKPAPFIPIQLRQSTARYPVEIDLTNGVVVRLTNESDGGA